MIRETLKYFTSNKVVRNFIFADLTLFGGWGLVSPIMAIFVVEEVKGANIVTVGILAGIYWAVRSTVQLPMAVLIEKSETERDDLYLLIIGLLLVSASAFWLNFVDNLTKLYIFQIIYALGFAFYAASWAGIFSRHIEKNKAAISWSLDHTLLGIATGITGLAGGYLADKFGFNVIFIAVGITSFLSAIIIFIVPEVMFPGRRKSVAPIMNHSPKTVLK
ncbi:MAG: MFS transporter [Parcubacteria group bacterium]